MGELLFVTGGARSGKSTFAEQLAVAEGRPAVYIATLEPLDDEMRDRIARHQARRPAGWSTVEAPRDLLAAFADVRAGACVLIDCLSLWVANCLLPLGDEPPRDALDALEAGLDRDVDMLIERARDRAGATIVVSNEVGSGLVPPYAIGRAYRDLLGRENQRVSRAADRAWLLVAGRALELPPA